MKQMTLKLHSMYAAASKLGYSLPFMNEICKRAYYSNRPFYVEKDKNGKYLVDAEDLRTFIRTCPDFNPYEIPGVYEPDSDDDDAPLDDTVFMLNEDMLPQVCGVLVDEESAPLFAYDEDAAKSAHDLSDSMEQFFRALQEPMFD